MRRYSNHKLVLRDVFGYDDFREGQERIILSLMSGVSCLVVMPTGSGKSLCYQVPALCMSGIAVVVSPLLALMRDQVRILRQANVRAFALNSSCSPLEQREIMQAIRNNQVDLLFVSPERLLLDSFYEFIKTLEIAFFAIDEAHCISQWGHDFRTEYLKLEKLKVDFANVPRIALTATADRITREEIMSRLDLKEDCVLSFNRQNINIKISEKTDRTNQLMNFISTKQGNGIIYCTSRNSVESIYSQLKQRGTNAYQYHAGFSAKDRMVTQDSFISDTNAVMVATIAFGMGINKPDVRFVAHIGLSKSIEAYYQEIGRAGRDGLPSEAWMAYNSQDISTHRYHAYGSQETSQALRSAQIYRLESLIGLCESSYCRKAIILHYFGENVGDGYACGNCDNCTNPARTMDLSSEAKEIVNYLLVHPSCLQSELISAIHTKEYVAKHALRQLNLMGYIAIDRQGRMSVGTNYSNILDNKATLKVRYSRIS